MMGQNCSCDTVSEAQFHKIEIFIRNIQLHFFWKYSISSFEIHDAICLVFEASLQIFALLP